MDEIDLQISLSEANGKANALLCLCSALITTLALKGGLSGEDLATLPGIANQMLEAMNDMSPEARQKADSVLKGLSVPWSTLVTRN